MNRRPINTLDQAARYIENQAPPSALGRGAQALLHFRKQGIRNHHGKKDDFNVSHRLNMPKMNYFLILAPI